MRHAGLVAHSPDGSALCFLEYCRAGFARHGAHLHPDITLDYIAMGKSLPAWDAGDHAAVRATLALSIARLAAAGADFFFCPDNTAHVALEADGPPFALPGLNIADVVADEAARMGHRRVGILGTRYTMEGPVYHRAFGTRGITAAVPDARDRETVNRIIFDELVSGILTAESRAAYVAIIERLKGSRCDAVALACTEIPLLVTPRVSPLPTLDSTRLLAQAAFGVAIADRPLPTWRGGPPRVRDPL
jgi:aspartate racemase